MFSSKTLFCWVKKEIYQNYCIQKYMPNLSFQGLKNIWLRIDTIKQYEYITGQRIKSRHNPLVQIEIARD